MSASTQTKKSESNRVVELPIVPATPSYYDLPERREIDLKAICCFVAAGYFLQDDTYFTNRKAFMPGSRYTFDQKGRLILREKHFHWHLQPREILFSDALEEFAEIIHTQVASAASDKRLLLPISGGLDSRVLAAALKWCKVGNVHAYSYELEGGAPENKYGATIAQLAGFEHMSFKVRQGYLWDVIEDLATINRCYADFINPRQMSIYGQMNDKGDAFLLGHGGDLFFDGMNVRDDLSHEGQVSHLTGKSFKNDALALASDLWNAWGLQGNFVDYFFGRIEQMLLALHIENANARLRAFKTEYYVARWTASNLVLFQAQKPIILPFFSDEICRFICTLPERYLAGRQLEIEYLKKFAPSLASVSWQKYHPCNLYNYTKFNSPPVMARRAWIKLVREIRQFFGAKGDARNWELQFLGANNRARLDDYLLNDPAFDQLVPNSVRSKYLKNFDKSPRDYWFSVSMLLTLALFSRQSLNKSAFQ